MNTLVKIYWLDLLIFILISAFTGWLMHHTFQYQDGQMIIASKAWSDFGAHVPLIRSFSYGQNIPVEYPHFAGEPITYHFIFYWLTGGLERMGLNIALALNLVSAFSLTGLMIAVYLLTKQWFKSRTAGIIALILMIFNGSLSFVIALTHNPRGWQSIFDVFIEKHFVSFGPWNGDLVSAFWNLNIYTNQRHLALGFLLVIVFLIPLITNQFNKLNKNIKISILGALLILSIIIPLINQVTIPLLGIIVFSWIMIYPNQYRWLLFYALVALLALPAHLLLSQTSNHDFTFHYGFLAQPGILEWLKYWIYNLGVYLVIFPFLLILSPKPIKALLLSGSILFVITNLIQLSPDIINNHKLINFFLLILNIATAGFILKIWQKRHYLKPIAISLLILLTTSGFMDFFPVYNDSYHYINDIPRSDTAKFILNNSDPQSIFLPADKFYNPASLAGRRLWFGYSYFPWSMGYDTGYREAKSRNIFASNIEYEIVCGLLIDQKIDYIIISSGKGQIGDTDVQQSIIVREFNPIFQNQTEGHSIYKVKENCYAKS